jgi:Protein of unknown function (DUF3892)
MTGYQIGHVRKQSGHGHIESVDLRSGTPYTQTFSVRQVLNMITGGSTFHTGSVLTRDYAAVEGFACPHCCEPTLRSHTDGAWNNNLDDLRPGR